MAPSIHDLSKEIQGLRDELRALTKSFQDHVAIFAWYWVTENRRVPAMITSPLKADRAADLVVFNDGWSGGLHIVQSAPFFDRLPALELPLDEQVKEYHWEPMLELPALLQSLVRQAKAEAEDEEAGQKASLFQKAVANASSTEAAAAS